VTVEGEGRKKPEKTKRAFLKGLCQLAAYVVSQKKLPTEREKRPKDEQYRTEWVHFEDLFEEVDPGPEGLGSWLSNIKRSDRDGKLPIGYRAVLHDLNISTALRRLPRSS
jgi:hypothetical protein